MTAAITCTAWPSSKAIIVHALDGDIGHIENLLADDDNWEIRYLVIATRNWWPGKVVQLAPYAVKAIDWFGEQHQYERHPRAGAVSAGLGPAGDGGRGQGGRSPSPFRLAGLPPVGQGLTAFARAPAPEDRRLTRLRENPAEIGAKAAP